MRSRGQRQGQPRAGRKPARPARSARPAKSAVPAKPAKRARPAKPAVPPEPARPAKPARLAKPARPAEPDDDAVFLGQRFAAIYQVVRRIPRGRVLTYGQVAELAGMPGAARAVGAAMRASSPALGLPWQRVVGKRGPATGLVRIHDAMGAGMQRALLEAEGVAFTDAGSISLGEYGWVPATPPEPLLSPPPEPPS
jgi:methylated-DNA-protein-cysteine methyltransferase-like protein